MPSGLRQAALVGACVLVIAAAVYILVMLLVRVAPLTLAVIVALFMAALVAPVSSALRRLRVPGWLAALAGVLTLLAAVVLPLILVGERTAGQLPNLRQRLNEGLERVRDMALNGPFPISEQQLNSLAGGLAKAARNAMPEPAAGASLAAQVLAAALLALVLLFFLLKDGELMWGWALARMPHRHRERMDAAARAGWQTLVAYVRGTVLVAFVDAVGIGLALVLIGVPLALPLTLLTFLAAFVPIVGATIAGAVAVLVAFVNGGPADALLVLAAVIVVQQAEGNLLQPLIMGRALKLHPAVVLVAVTAGTLLGGIAGGMVAVPLTAVGYRVATVLRISSPDRKDGAQAGRRGDRNGGHEDHLDPKVHDDPKDHEDGPKDGREAGDRKPGEGPSTWVREDGYRGVTPDGARTLS